MTEVGQTIIAKPKRRVILLGASNVARGISTIIESSQHLFCEPLEFMAAFGHGRSYGLETSVFFRKLSGIFFCDLWTALSNSKSMPTTALLTDIGNDILYGASNEQILDWVEGCLDRLEESGAKTVITSLPIDNIHRLSERQFLFIRTVLFPAGRLSLKETAERALRLNESVQELACARQVSLIPQKNEWFGFDPIHIRRRHWATAWPEIIRPWTESENESKPVQGSLARWLRVRTLVPQERWLFGIHQTKTQPCHTFRDGSTLALY